MPGVLWVILATLGGAAASEGLLPQVATVQELSKLAKPAKAKVILLNMWGQKCSRCMTELPAIVRVVTALASNPDVGFIGLCIPEGELQKDKTLADACSALAQKKKLNYPNYIWAGTGDALVDAFNIQGTPYNCLMTTDGKIIAELDIPEDPDKAVEYVLAAIQKALKDPTPKERGTK